MALDALEEGDYVLDLAPYDEPRHARGVATLESALWALNATDTFEEALVAAVNLGGDSDSIGAVCGQLAGAKYGFSAIPERWLAAVKDRAVIEALFSQFMAALPQATLTTPQKSTPTSIKKSHDE